MSVFTPAAYEPADREQLLALMRATGGTRADAAEFDWWFERNPSSPRLISVARADGRVIGSVAMSFFRMLVGGCEELVAVPVRGATDPDYRRQGVYSTLVLRNESEAAAAGVGLAIAFPNAATHQILIRNLGWSDVPGRRLWARPLRAGSLVRYAIGRDTGQGGLRPPSRETRDGVRPLERFGPDAGALWRASAGGNQFVRDETFLNWRYVDAPWDYRCFGAYRREGLSGLAIVGHTSKHGLSSGFVADLVASGESARIALLRRCVAELAPRTDAVIALVPHAHQRSYLRAGFLPTRKRIRFVVKSLDGRALPGSETDWHFTLGDFDFF